MRVIKFRHYFPSTGVVTAGHDPLTLILTATGKEDFWKEAVWMQYTGLKDKNGKEIYEGDIFRIEESGANGEPDEIFYVVITWIKEWCMFGSLIAKSEYQDYIDNGVKALDEPLFWTYTLEDTDSRKHFLCGNIYETPNLLK